MSDPANGQIAVRVSVNGHAHHALVNRRQRLFDFLRDHLGLNETRIDCDDQRCSSCMILLDGHCRRSCTTPISEVEGAAIITLEGLTGTREFGLVQRAFADRGGAPCNACVAGVTLALVGLLRQVGRPARDEIIGALAVIECNCGSHGAVATAIEGATRTAADIERRV